MRGASVSHTVHRDSALRAAAPYGARSGLATARWAYARSRTAASGVVRSSHRGAYRTIRPTAYVNRDPGTARPSASRRCGRAESAARKTSKGAPLAICAYNCPVAPRLVSTTVPVAARNRRANSACGAAKFPATAARTTVGSRSASRPAQPWARRRRASHAVAGARVGITTPSRGPVAPNGDPCWSDSAIAAWADVVARGLATQGRFREASTRAVRVLQRGCPTAWVPLTPLLRGDIVAVRDHPVPRRSHRSSI